MTQSLYGQGRRQRASAQEYHWRAPWYDEQFQAAIDLLQERIGYTFVNRTILIQALTSPGFAALFPVKCASNAPLEPEGDKILREHVGNWLHKVGLTTRKVEHFLTSLFNSNLYFSRRALELHLDGCVRMTLNQMRSQRPESKIRTTANAFEALVAAIERDAGPSACRAFVARFVLPDDSLLQSVALMASVHSQNVERGFARIVGDRAQLHVLEGLGNAEAHVTIGGKDVTGRTEDSRISDAARIAILRVLTSHPWLFWGCDGDVSPYLPCAANYAYGTPVSDQWSYRSGRSKTPLAWMVSVDSAATVLSVVNAPVVQAPTARTRFHEEDAWPIHEMPDVLPSSTLERGPYIDKLRIRLGDASLEVRVNPERKSNLSRYAFYVAGEYVTTIGEQKNLSDAANQILRLLDAREKPSG